MLTVIFLLAVLISSLISFPLIHSVLHSIGHKKKNFSGRMVTQSIGIAYLPVFIIALLFLFAGGLFAGINFRVIIFLVILGMAGLADDFWGSGSERGLKGHFLALIVDKKVTTGLGKAAAILAASLWTAAGVDESFSFVLFGGALLSVSANFFNLLDLRPGRAIKALYLFSFYLIFYTANELVAFLMFPFWLASLIWLPQEMCEKGMLGDAGANLLGGMLGLAVLLAAPYLFQLIFLLLLLAAHLLAERYSFSKIIEKNDILNYFDNLGREIR